MEEKAESGMEARTTSDKLTQAPITVRLGGETYEIPIPPYAQARKWRKALAEYQKQLLPIATMALAAQDETDDELTTQKKNMALMTDNLDVLSSGVIDGMIDLLFVFWPDAPRETLENSCTEKELLVVAGQIVKSQAPLAQMRHIGMNS